MERIDCYAASGNPGHKQVPPNTRMQPDAAARPQDQGVFEIRYRLLICTDLSVAARLMRRPFGGRKS